MKSKPIQTITAGALIATLLTLTSCSSTPPPASPSPSSVVTAPPVQNQGQARGEIQIEASVTTATVVSIDYKARRVTLRRFDGALFDCKVGPQAVNFNKVQVGDEVLITVAEECVTFVGKNGEMPGDDAAMVVRVLVNGVPSGMVANTVDVKAKVLDVDIEAQRLVVEISKGEARRVKVAPGVNLTNLHPGDDVNLRITEAVAVTLEKQ